MCVRADPGLKDQEAQFTHFKDRKLRLKEEQTRTVWKALIQQVYPLPHVNACLFPFSLL